MHNTTNEKNTDKQKVPGTQDAVSSGRSDHGQKKEEVNFGYENGQSKRDGQIQDGENPDEGGIDKEWQDRARINLEKTSPDTNSNTDRDFEKEIKLDSSAGKPNPYF